MKAWLFSWSSWVVCGHSNKHLQSAHLLWITIVGCEPFILLLHYFFPTEGQTRDLGMPPRCVYLVDLADTVREAKGDWCWLGWEELDSVRTGRKMSDWFIGGICGKTLTAPNLTQSNKQTYSVSACPFSFWWRNNQTHLLSAIYCTKE